MRRCTPTRPITRRRLARRCRRGLARRSRRIQRARAAATSTPDQPGGQRQAAASTAAAGAIPADVRARVVAKLPGAQAPTSRSSPIPGLYEVTMGGLIAYVSADGKYLSAATSTTSTRR